IVDYTDRFVHLLDGVHNEQALNEKLGHYFLSIGRLSYAKMYLEKAIPALDKFKDALVFHATNEDNIYRHPALRSLSVMPAELTEGIQFDDEDRSEERRVGKECRGGRWGSEYDERQ